MEFFRDVSSTSAVDIIKGDDVTVEVPYLFFFFRTCKNGPYMEAMFLIINDIIKIFLE